MCPNPVLIHVPHSSREIPAAEASHYFLTNDEMETELNIMTDHFTDQFLSAAKAEYHVLRYKYSRLLVDPERFRNDDAEPMADKGMGATYVKRHNGEPMRRLSSQDSERLKRTYYDPHHKEFADVVDNMLKQFGHAVIIDIHSYPERPLPFELYPKAARPDICLGADDHHTPDTLLELACLTSEEVGHL